MYLLLLLISTISITPTSPVPGGSCTPGAASKLQKFFRTRQRKNSIKITGSILYDYPPQKTINNIEFRKKYDLSENEKIIVLFPKSIFFVVQTSNILWHYFY